VLAAAQGTVGFATIGVSTCFTALGTSTGSGRSMNFGDCATGLGLGDSAAGFGFSIGAAFSTGAGFSTGTDFSTVADLTTTG
ncbi:hypothetical protein NY486_08080, partial [Enterobacter hormaechei]|nr:hypothetical protein [Enterobacter hormaechei]